MLYTLFIAIIILLMLGAERCIVTSLTKKASWQCRIRNTWYLTPNGISLLRLPQGAIAIAFAYHTYWTTAILWFAFWMITDLSDGTIARNCNLETPTGKWLDPLSDKFMDFPALVYLSVGHNVISPRLTLWMVITYCVIDVLGQCSRLFCKKTAANSFGKAKTALVTILIGILALNQLRIPELTYLNQRMADAMMLTCIVLSFLSLYCKVIPNHWYANSFTLLNFSCGVAAILNIWIPFLSGELLQKTSARFFITSFLLVFAGQFFDLFDGKMARKYGSTRRGALFDDIADGTSFGLALGSLLFIGLGWCCARPIPPVVSGVLALFYIGCIVWRLYRFIHPTMDLPKGIFQGMPSPAGALLTGSAIIVCIQFNCPSTQFIAILCTLFASLMMISNIPYRHFGQNLWPSMPRFCQMLILIITMVFACFGWARHDWGTAFSCMTTFLSLAYAIFAIASRKLLSELRNSTK